MIGRRSVPAENKPQVTARNILGRIESFDLDAGIIGWAYDAADRAETLDIELVAGDLLLAMVSTDRYRGDLGGEDDPMFNPGFVFSGSTLRAAAANSAADPEKRLSIRVAGHGPLDGTRLPTLRALRAAVEAEGLPKRDLFGLDLRRTLSLLTEDAVMLRRRPIRPIAAYHRGDIIRVSPIDRHTLAFSGWCHRDVEPEQSAVLLDGEKHPAAFSIATFERTDLPDHAHAFVGVLRTEWRPRSHGSEPFLFFGPNGEYHFRSASLLKAVPIGALESDLAKVPAGGLQNRVMDLRQVLLSNEGWAPRSDMAAGLGMAVGVDRILLLPGFGALVEGWVLSGVRRQAGMALKLGGKVLHLDPSSLRRQPRLDLVNGFPALKDGAPTAGFCGFFVGALGPSDLLGPMLKVHFTDGAALTVEVNPAILQQLDAGFDVDALQRGYPSLASEPLFEAFADARSTIIRKQLLASAQPVLRARADQVVVQILPLGAHDLQLVLDGMARNVRALPQGCALALVGDPRQSRDIILTWIAAARERAPGIGISLSIVESVDHALFAVPAVLQFHKALRFVYVGPDLWLTAEGWSRIAELLVRSDDELVSLPVSMRVHGAEVDQPDDELFGWSTAAFSRWVECASVPFDEAARRRGLPHGRSMAGSRAALRIRPTGRSSYKARLDETLFATSRIAD